MKPLIGITMNLDKQLTRSMNGLDQDYGRSVVKAGGIPVPILGIEDSVHELVKRLDGFIFTGGDDIQPKFYKEKPLAGARITISPDERTRFEIALFQEITKAKKPILAICYGTQLINVALGGRLFQDIGLQVRRAGKHGTFKAGEKIFHPVSVFEGTKLSGILGLDDCRKSEDCSIRVRSNHHQSIKNPGRGLRLAAVSPDGVYEALESRSRDTFLIAVQWHPEKTPNDRHSKKLFKALVTASKKQA